MVFSVFAAEFVAWTRLSLMRCTGHG